MAKKGQAVQLQTEVNNDDDWSNLLQKDGLIVADVYSEWCGPCSGMVATLKKIKLEIGGDALHLAIAKAEGVTDLNRFIGKSEPTWMLIAKGKMTNYLFGANAPKLTQLITDELKKEMEAMEGRRERVLYDIEEPTPIEKKRLAKIEAERLAEEEHERQKIAEEVLERRTKECTSILENLSHYGVIIVLPNATKRYQDIIHDLLNEAGLVLTKTEKVQIKKEILEELFYFVENQLPDLAIEEILKLPSLILLLKRSFDNTQSTIDDVICQMVYGNLRKPPGDEKTPYQQLLIRNENIDIPGLWSPLNSLTKAVCLKLFFPNISAPFLLPVTPLPTLYIAVAYDVFKYRNVMELSTQYPGQVMKYGFFTSDIPGEAKLIAKTIDKFENRTDLPTYEEKFVIQLAKTQRDCVDALLALGTSYRSKDGVVGVAESKLFFPSNYDEPDENPTQIRRKKRKSKAKITVQTNQAENNQENIAEYVCGVENEQGDLEETIVESELIVEGGDSDEDDADGEEGSDGEGVDKATSPMNFVKIDNKDEV